MGMFSRRKSEPNDEPKRKLVGLKHLYTFIKPYRSYFFVGMFFLILSSTTVLVFPFITGKLVDAATGKNVGIFKDINQIAIYLFFILIAQATFSFLRIWTFAIVTERTMSDVRKAVFNKLLVLPLPFFEKNRVGELSSRISADVSQLQSVLSITFAEFFRQVATLLVGTSVILFTSPRLTLVMLCTFPVMVVAAVIFGKRIKKLSGKTQDKLAETNVIVEETMQAISVVKAFTNELYERLRYGKKMEDVVKLALKNSKYRAVFVSFIIFAIFGGIVFVLWYGAFMVESGHLTIGELTSFIIYTTVIGAAAGGLGDLYSQIQKTLGAIERIREILAEDSEVTEEELQESENSTVNQISGSVKFQNVSFSYPTRQDIEVLKSIDFEIKPGEKVALVGQSGAGKSTIAQLLLRFYQLERGDILLDEKSISDYSFSEYRKYFGLVSQEVILFGGTILENILYGNPKASQEEIELAAKKAHAYDFIMEFPEKFDTVVGERGIKLSGGQKQRIAIARAILKNPQILVLDEATSALDNQSEKYVQAALDELMKDKTSLIIAHRLSTVKDVDEILVVENGAIVEKGNYAELMNNPSGIFYNLNKSAIFS